MPESSVSPTPVSLLERLRETHAEEDWRRFVRGAGTAETAVAHLVVAACGVCHGGLRRVLPHVRNRL